MLEKHPNRKKDKYNPYTLTIAEGHYYLSFKDGRGKQQNIEIDEMLYQTFDRFELEDISHLNRVSTHIEHSDLTEETLNDRAFYKAERIEDIKRTMILPSSHSPSGNQSAAGNGGSSVRPTVGVQLPWRQFAADRLVISLA